MARAQGKGPKDGKGEKMDPKAKAELVTEKMAKDLSLTDKQKQQVLELNITEFTGKAECKAKPVAPAEGQAPQKPTQEEREKMRAEREACRAAYDAKLKTILTPEQYTKFTEQQNKNNKDGKKGGKDKKGNKGGERKQK